MMKRTLVLASAAAIVFALGLVAATAKANFSGAWTLDKTKSEGLPSTIKDQTLTVTQTDDKISIETKITTDEGEDNIKDVYVADGKTVDFTTKAQGGLEVKGKRTSKWTADGNGLEISENGSIDTPNGVVDLQIARKWTLSADGKQLTIDRTLTSAMGTQQIKSVFIKK